MAGYLMICAFGLPGNLHEDDPKRAVQTALAIRENLKAQGQDSAMGVTTGKLLCTLVGGKKRCEYTVFGDTINLSARLMMKAKNEVQRDNI
jgi:class 3 adenylate cyclase